MNVDERVAGRLILAAALAGLVLRLLFGFVYWTGKPLTHDEREYLALAANVAAGRGFVYAGLNDIGTSPQFGRAPGYPFVLAVIGAGSVSAEHSPTRIKVVQSLIGAGIVWLIGLWAMRAGGAKAGVLSAVLAALYPPLVWMPSYVLSETLYSAVALAAALLLQRSLDDEQKPATAWAMTAGLLTGASILIRPAMLFFVPLAALWLAARRRHVLLLAFVGAAVLVVAPWTIRNAAVHGRFVLVASEGGVTFWTGNHPLSVGEGDLAANESLKRAELEFRALHAGRSAEQLEPLYYRDALRHIADDPVWWVSLIARKAFYTVVPVGPSYALHSTRYRIASVSSYLLVLPFAVAGVRRYWGSMRQPTALLLLAASAVLVSLVFFPQERFRIPVIDPTLIVCAGGIVSRFHS